MALAVIGGLYGHQQIGPTMFNICGPAVGSGALSLGAAVALALS